MTSLYQSKFFQNLLEFFDWLNDMALRSIQGLYKPCCALGFEKETVLCTKLNSCYPSPLLCILPALLPPLFMSKELDIHLAKIQGVVMPGIEGCRTSSTGCCSNFRKLLKIFLIRFRSNFWSIDSWGEDISDPTWVDIGRGQALAWLHQNLGLCRDHLQGNQITLEVLLLSS